MKIQLISDTHHGIQPECTVLHPGAEVFVIAGDLVSKPDNARYYLESLRKQTDIPVIYVLGNHEYYDLNLYSAVDTYKKTLGGIPDVHVLNNEVFSWNGVNFLGSTLWSDLSDPLGALAVQTGLADYDFIEVAPGKYIQASDTHREFTKAVKWLDTELDTLEAQTNVVITHHAPCWECRNTYFDYDKYSRLRTQGFCNRLNALMYKHDVSHWLYGHTHKSYNFKSRGTRVVSNQVGLIHEAKWCNYNRDLIIEV